MRPRASTARRQRRGRGAGVLRSVAMRSDSLRGFSWALMLASVITEPHAALPGQAPCGPHHRNDGSPGDQRPRRGSASCAFTRLRGELTGWALKVARGPKTPSPLPRGAARPWFPRSPPSGGDSAAQRAHRNRPDPPAGGTQAAAPPAPGSPARPPCAVAPRPATTWWEPHGVGGRGPIGLDTLHWPRRARPASRDVRRRDPGAGQRPAGGSVPVSSQPRSADERAIMCEVSCGARLVKAARAAATGSR